MCSEEVSFALSSRSVITCVSRTVVTPHCPPHGRADDGLADLVVLHYHHVTAVVDIVIVNICFPVLHWKFLSISDASITLALKGHMPE